MNGIMMCVQEKNTFSLSLKLWSALLGYTQALSGYM